MNRILVPYDFSEIAEHAMAFAVEIAKQSDASEVLLLNILEHPSESRLKLMGATDMDPMQNVFFGKLLEKLKGNFEHKLSDLGYADVNIQYKIQIGSPFQSLASEVNQNEVDLVVMGTHGAEGWNEIFLGSNTERVVRTAKCPVIAIKSATRISDINDIVFASSFEGIAPEFAEKIKELQKIMDADLRLVKVNCPASFTTTRHDRELMENFVRKYDIKDFTIDVYNASNEEEGIVDYATDIDADMIALGTTQRRGFSHFISGSIAEDVVNRAPQVVWVMPFDK